MFLRLTRMAEVLSGASDCAPLPYDLRVPLEARSPALPAGALPSDPPCFCESGPALGNLSFLF